HAVVEDDVLGELITMRAHGLGLAAEGDAGGVVAGDAVALEEIVRVLVADGNAATLVAVDDVVGEQAVLHTPAHVKAVLTVAKAAIVADRWLLGTAPRMQAMSGVTMGKAAFHDHLARDLKTDAIGVAVMHRAAADGDVFALKEIDAA